MMNNWRHKFSHCFIYGYTFKFKNQKLRDDCSSLILRVFKLMTPISINEKSLGKFIHCVYQQTTGSKGKKNQFLNFMISFFLYFIFILFASNPINYESLFFIFQVWNGKEIIFVYNAGRFCIIVNLALYSIINLNAKRQKI